MCLVQGNRRLEIWSCVRRNRAVQRRQVHFRAWTPWTCQVSESFEYRGFLFFCLGVGIGWEFMFGCWVFTFMAGIWLVFFFPLFCFGLSHRSVCSLHNWEFVYGICYMNSVAAVMRDNSSVMKWGREVEDIEALLVEVELVSWPVEFNELTNAVIFSSPRLTRAG